MGGKGGGGIPLVEASLACCGLRLRGVRNSLVTFLASLRYLTPLGLHPVGICVGYHTTKRISWEYFCRRRKGFSSLLFLPRAICPSYCIRDETGKKLVAIPVNRQLMKRTNRTFFCQPSKISDPPQSVYNPQPHPRFCGQNVLEVAWGKKRVRPVGRD